MRMNERQLKEALTVAQSHMVSLHMQQELTAQWPKHKDALVQALEGRMRERASSLQKTLTIRSEKEQRDIRSILSELQESIRKELSQPAVVQLQFTGFSQDERQQYERDLDVLSERANQIDDEIRQEVERVQKRFADPQPRLFPVAITYLVPERLAH